MNFIYKIIFNSRIEAKTPPYYYIGSKTNAEYINNKIIDKNGKEYFGSSRYTGFKSMIDDKIEVIILEEYENISHLKLLEIESQYQHECNAKTNIDYFNLEYACGHNSYCNSDYATYKHFITGKAIRLTRDHELVINGEYVGITKGNKLSESHKHSISCGISGSKNGFYGKTHSDETIKSLSNKTKLRLKENHPRQKAVVINGIKYRGVRPASRELGINKNTIINNIRKGIIGWNYA